MGFGELDRMLTLQRPDAASGTGYVDVLRVWGSLRLLAPSGSETLRHGAPMAIAVWKSTIRYRTDVRAEWRLVDADEGRTFQISSYGDVDGERKYLQLFVTEVQ